MFRHITPEEAGISSANILEFMKVFEFYNLSVHSMIMARGNDIFTECYYAPFNADTKHRMYSISKTFIAVAAGLLIEDGKLSLDDKLYDFFPEYHSELHSQMFKDATIRDMLTMESPMFDKFHMFKYKPSDRAKLYFDKAGDHHPGTMFDYDSPGSYMVCAVVEKICGKPILDFMRERFLDDIGFSKDAYSIGVPGGYTFADSGFMCTSMDLLRFARFMLNGGTWNGKRYMNEAFLIEATSKLVDNSVFGTHQYNSMGYGYLTWRSYDDGFALVGMGDQFAVCDPAHDFIFVITADNQGNADFSRAIMFHELYKTIVHKLTPDASPIPENKQAYDELCDYIKNAKLVHTLGEKTVPFADELCCKTYRLESNRMGIQSFCLEFDKKGEKGTIRYVNEQGEKNFDFGFGYNIFGKFPQDGYANLMATVPEPGYRYECAFSAAWVEQKKLRIYVQSIDKHMGKLSMVFGFKDEKVTVKMTTNAQGFFEEYTGFANGYLDE